MTSYLQRTTSAAPLAIFRIAFGLLLFAGMVRFWANGWIEELYIAPKHFFNFYGFEFVAPLGEYTYLLFAFCATASLLVALGWHYRIASVALFVSFTYIELMDKSTYLNHYYFVSMVCLIMIFLPAHAYFSIDSRRLKGLAASEVPQWCVDSLKAFVCIIYLFAGLAKINTDWLLEAQPLRIWLPAKNDLPVIGRLFNYTWVAFAFSWFGCLYDLAIPFLLLVKRTRVPAYIAVIVFHVLTAIMFPIGMFPFIMIATGLIFFPGYVHDKIIVVVSRMLRISPQDNMTRSYQYNAPAKVMTLIFFAGFFASQIVLPFRHLAYPGEVFWTEQGYRFSWRVMLMEKAGSAQFVVRDSTGKIVVVDNAEFLTPLQEKMVATQPDMIVQYAHILRDHYKKLGFENPRVYADTYVALNGRLGKPLVDPHTDLANEKDSFAHKPWIMPFDHEIKGF